jgi:hypothetical protein
MNATIMESDEAAVLKETLRARAEEYKIDLQKAENRYAFWSENGPQGYLGWGRSEYPAEIYRIMGYYMFSGCAILEITDSGDRVMLFSCEVG